MPWGASVRSTSAASRQASSDLHGLNPPRQASRLLPRRSQPYEGGVATDDSGVIVLDGGDFRFDLLGRAFGFTVSMKVDGGAGEVFIDPT